MSYYIHDSIGFPVFYTLNMIFYLRRTELRINYFLTVLGIIVFCSFFPAKANARGNDLFEESITIDGRSYHVAPGFSIPAGIDKDSPVKLVFTDDTHELLSIERICVTLPGTFTEAVVNKFRQGKAGLLYCRAALKIFGHIYHRSLKIRPDKLLYCKGNS